MKGFEAFPGDGGKGEIGWKVRRKDASELRCLTVKDLKAKNSQSVLFVLKSLDVTKHVLEDMESTRV